MTPEGKGEGFLPLSFYRPRSTVDGRQLLFAGKRPARLLKQDVPLLAQAMLGVMRRKYQFGVFHFGGQKCVRFWSGPTNLVVFWEDWEKVIPLLAEEAFSPLRNVSYQVTYLHPSTAYAAPTQGSPDYELYQYMVGVLSPLFPSSWPTSTI